MDVLRPFAHPRAFRHCPWRGKPPTIQLFAVHLVFVVVVAVVVVVVVAAAAVVLAVQE